MNNTTMGVDQKHGSSSTRPRAPGEVNFSGRDEGHYRSGSASTAKDKTLIVQRDADSASLVADSTFSGYTPSSIETRGLLTDGRRIKPDRPHRTVGRSAFVGVCRVVNVVAPIDFDEDVKSMQGSSLAKLARTVKRKETYHDVQAARSSSI